MTNRKSIIAITGATGFVGTVLTRYFLREGWTVIALTREPGHIRHKNLEYRTYSMTKPLSADTLDGVDYLVHTAYVKLDRNTPDAIETNINGSKYLIKAAEKASVSQLIFMSTMSAHNDAISAYAKQKVAIEKLFLNTKHAAIIRSGLIIGNGGIVREMANFMKTKRMVPLIDGGNQPLQIISVHDLAKVIHNIIDKNLNGRFVVATPEVYSYKTFYKAIAKELNIKILYIPVPYKALELAFKLASALRIPLGVGEDNLKGLKMLRSMPSENDLARIGIKLVDLEHALQKNLSK